MVVSRLKPDSPCLLNELLLRLEARVVLFEASHIYETLSAFRPCGKGRYPAALNFGDCLSYAVARVSALPLAYVGENFARTDPT
nr:type II toxin-antitoxin system VapC family toxin [Meiothermus sp. QL-1]